MSNLYQKVCLYINIIFFLVFNFCENYNIALDLSKNPSSNNFSPVTNKKMEYQNNNGNTISLKNEPNTKYKNAFEILNNMNNNKYTLKYIEENKLKNKNSENDYNNNMNMTPININSNVNRLNKNNKCYNRSSSYLNKLNNNSSIKGDKYKNRSTKKSNTAKSIGKDKEKIKENIQEYKINNLSSSFNNNFTNIKTNKIVFIDLKDNDNNFLKSDLNNDDYQNENKYNDRYMRNGNPNEEVNNNSLLRSSGSGFNKNNKVGKPTTSGNVNHNKLVLSNINKKSNLINSNNYEPKKEKSFYNLKVQNLDQSKPGNASVPNNFSIFEDKKGKELVISRNNLIKLEDLKSKGLSKKESSYYILSKSPVLRLCERMIFSRGSLALRNLLSKESTIKEHQIILNNKIDELEKKIILCDKILETPFTASKTADITLNFITSLMEMEFKEYPILLANEEEKKYYITFIKLLYHLFNIEIEVNGEENNILDKNSNILNLRQNLYTKINSKGFRSIKDILYNQFINNKETIKDIPKIAEINYLVSQVNNMFEIHNSLKMCKFISFTLYIIQEIINFYRSKL